MPGMLLMCEAGVGLDGSVMFIICMPLSTDAVTIAYIEDPMVTAVMSRAPSSSSNPFTPSVTAAMGTGLNGSVMSIIWTPLSRYEATSA